MKKTSIGNSFLLLVTACIWGMAFVSQSKGMEYMKPLTFNGVRCVIGAASLLGYLLVTGKMTGKKKLSAGIWKKSLVAGLWCGLVFTAASGLQQYGILYTTVGKAGFITTLYIIFVPLIGLFLHRKAAGVVWIAAVMAAVGMYLLCMTESLALGMGDVLIFLCAVFFAIHILVIDHFSEGTDGAVISCVQFLVCGVVCTTGALIWEEPGVVQLIEGSGALLYAGVLSCGVAYTLQIIGQKGVAPTVAALILSLESVVAAVSGLVAFRIGFLKVDQTLTTRQIVGCMIVFAAVILVQLPTDCFWGKKTYN